MHENTILTALLSFQDTLASLKLLRGAGKDIIS